MSEHTIQDLKIRQKLPLEIKIRMTEQRIREWIDYYGIDGVYVSFSGGKDSTVLLHIARRLYPDIKAVFVDTGLEYPEIREFVKTFDNVEWLKPKMTFKQVIEKYGYPFISKEVSECVQGARKYLTELIADGTIITDRQTDRRHKYAYRYNKLCGVGEYSKFSVAPTADNKAIAQGSRGGYDSKYRKLRGIGEFAKKENGKPRGRGEREVADSVGRVTAENEKDGDYP